MQEPEVIEESTKELLTEVTSVAKEEAKTGQTIVPKMSQEEFVARASQSFYQNRKHFAAVWEQLSNRGRARVMHAVLDLPTEGIPVLLKDQDEKTAFMLGQQIIQSRFVIMQYHISQEVKRMQQEQADKQQSSQETSNEQPATTEA